jgi:hypothetical protein
MAATTGEPARCVVQVRFDSAPGGLFWILAKRVFPVQQIEEERLCSLPMSAAACRRFIAVRKVKLANDKNGIRLHVDWSGLGDTK